MRVKLSYGQVETILAKMNRIADSKRVAFRARLKHFQREGWPEGANTGTGKKAVYGFTGLMQMVLAVELAQAGFAPKRIVQILKNNWAAIRFSLLVAVTPDKVLSSWTPPFPVEDANFAWVINPESLRELSEEGEGKYDYYDAVDIVPIARLAEEIESSGPILGEFWRTLVLQARAITFIAATWLTDLYMDVSLAEIRLDIEEEIRAHNEGLCEAMEAVRLFSKERKNGDDQKA